MVKYIVWSGGYLLQGSVTGGLLPDSDSDLLSDGGVTLCDGGNILDDSNQLEELEGVALGGSGKLGHSTLTVSKYSAKSG